MNFLDEALKEANKALELNEVPVGAIIVKDGSIISRGYNLKEKLNDSLAHAEIIAIKKAQNKLKSWRLNGCEMYVTLEPCPMCAGAIINSRISKLYIGTFDPNFGACGSAINLLQNNHLNTGVDIKWLYDKKCSSIITNFFKLRRK